MTPSIFLSFFETFEADKNSECMDSTTTLTSFEAPACVKDSRIDL